MGIINDLEITDTAYGGFGVGREPSGRVVFVPGTVEGDTADVKITDDKKSFAYAELVRIKKQSPFRVKPLCPRAGKCGGCLFAHIGYEAQINIKLKIIKNAFRKIENLPEIAVHKSPRAGYRIRAGVKAVNGVTGFFAFKSKDFVAAEECCVIKPSLLDKIAEFACMNRITGEIRATETPAGIALASVKAEGGAAAAIRPFDGVCFNGRRAGIGHTAYDTPFGPVGVGCGSFFQSNSFLIDAFQAEAVSKVPPGVFVAELYAGAGFFTCGLKATGNKVAASELDGEAARLAEIYGYPVKRSDSGAFLRGIPAADCIFMDPPRDGVSSEVITEIKRLSPVCVVYVSCNPVTLARDVSKLSGLYALESLDFFDMFPDTGHIETIVLLRRKTVWPGAFGYGKELR